MGRTKQKKIDAVKFFPNVFVKENLSEAVQKYFSNNNPLSLEIGCGEGDYTLALAKNFSGKNFMGIDIKPSRIYIGARSALDENIHNTAFIAGRIERLYEIFGEASIQEIYIPFPDPHVRRRSAPRRLISHQFISIYKKILTKNGRIHFKTDNEILFEFGLENLKQAGAEIIKINYNVHNSDNLTLPESITTRYEKHYIKEGRTIKYLCCGF
ncbi:MAG: tRNA (guanosine(46)-N7)-methyltransferase TrmB [Melioribacteraceae bacterium]|nr:tRNA (guanosine(46)-N7)-methyltransferase TrmB [Melioribacteraceae bacterium]